MVDIIIPVWNELELTRACIESIKRSTKTPFRLIIIDNGSEKETREYLENVRDDPDLDVILIRNDSNIGYLKAVNQGLKQSDSKYVCILNNDTVVTDNWLDKMVDFAERHDDVGLINPVLKKKRTPSAPDNLDKIVRELESRKGEYIELDHCVGACLLIKKGVIRDIGLFDDIYGFGHWEDNDYSRRAQKAGYKCIRLLDTLVWHYVSRSFNKIENWKSLSEQNKKIFYERWGEEIILIYPFPERLPMERARSIQYINTCFSLARNGVKVYMIIPGNEGDRRRILDYYGIIDHENVSFVFLPAVRVKVKELVSVTINHVFYLGSLFYILWLLRKLRKRDEEKKIFILTRHPKLANFLYNFKNLIKAKFIYEVHEIFSETAGSKKRKFLKIENKLFNKSDGLITITNHLKKELMEKYGIRKPISVIRDGVNIKHYNRKDEFSDEKESIVIYIGQTFPWKGVDILIRASKYIKGNVVIIGGEEKNLKELKKMSQDLGIENIRFIGWIKPADVRKFLNQASVGVIPLKRDTISQYYTSPLKMFEYMACGIPIVASDLPSVREVLRNEENAILVEPDNPIDLAQAINRILDDKELARRISENALMDVREYSWDERAKRIKDFILKEI